MARPHGDSSNAQRTVTTSNTAAHGIAKICTLSYETRPGQTVVAACNNTCGSNPIGDRSNKPECANYCAFLLLTSCQS